MMTIFSCSDFGLRSRKKENRAEYPPAKMFKGGGLLAAQKMFDGDLSGMEQVIKEKKIDINTLQEETGYTLLMYASIIENLNAMEKLLELGADPNIIVPNEGLESPLNHAVALNNYEMLQLLFKYKANPNPELGHSPLSKAMLLGGTDTTEKKMIDYLLQNGADINNISFNGSNIMEDAIRDDLNTAEYFLSKGGQPKIKNTNLCPMANYIEYKENQKNEGNLPDSPYYQKLFGIKKQLIDKYKVTFPYRNDTIAEAKLRIQLYEKLNPKDKISVNFNKNYGESRYQDDLAIVKGR
ncbi:Ankyrin repeat-containing protein [Chryseobacterium indologenes]|uniref:ankyrin repeat domain-containing protein n=1 Tax=Chryseobacterium indologenes TaxID=253 RepID=UPI0004AEBFA7|nr:ankyrin repeat domain-containing protein [Chryseobacterium indologenes]SFK48215.1 Ankyrin repeat-containing protein [Chryseobacterium indologenes]SUX53058.1 Ankyrin repeats (3 copies) [Chryseobacterium indologenes]